MSTIEELTPTIVRELAANPTHPLLLKHPTEVATFLLELALREGTTERSLLHANFRNQHSIMLFDRQQTGGGKLRMFYAEEGKHDMDQFYDDATGDYHLRPHDHRFDLTLLPLVGKLRHLETEEARSSSRYNLHKFAFTTAVGNDTFGLSYMGEQPLHVPDEVILEPGMTHTLDRDTIHSLAAYNPRPQSTTAWLVIEGAQTKQGAHLYSQVQEPRMDATGLYVPATNDDVERIITDTLEKMRLG